ncbi:hypothetical protein Ahy_B09g095268 [Arachis hypogaea]|uniref:Zinc finger GRF-type domain-containing protein n=1 Tax=Arachis hypogaea TaxID=3818 RepID=A0A444XDH9_ARAHY|nr:hypothetical protein Ahy_B09g095268 [Arachis hypogaea]
MRSRTRPSRVPERCGCGCRPVLRWSKTNTNPDKPFFCCPNYNSSRPPPNVRGLWLSGVGIGLFMELGFAFGIEFGSVVGFDVLPLASGPSLVFFLLTKSPSQVSSSHTTTSFPAITSGVDTLCSKYTSTTPSLFCAVKHISLNLSSDVRALSPPSKLLPGGSHQH